MVQILTPDALILLAPNKLQSQIPLFLVHLDFFLWSLWQSISPILLLSPCLHHVLVSCLLSPSWLQCRGALAGPLPFSIFTLSVGDFNTIWMRMTLTFISSALTAPHISNCFRDINIWMSNLKLNKPCSFQTSFLPSLPPSESMAKASTQLLKRNI